MIRQVSIIGAGLIGQQWAMLLAAHDYQVTIYDCSQDQIEKCTLTIRENIKSFIIENISRSKDSAETQIERIKTATKYSDLPLCSEFVFECVNENIEIKTNAFRIIDEYFSPETIRISSSSFIPVSRFTDGLVNQRKCIIAHPVNPPYFLRLVELVPAPYTDPDTVSRTRQLLEDIGQVPVLFKKEIEGFALNRIQAAVYNSVFKLIDDDVMSVGDVDKLLTEGLGPRWAFYGPLAVAALNGPGVDKYCDKYLGGLDTLNEAQNYPPQHNRRVIERIVGETNFGDLDSIYEERNRNIGQILNVKMNRKK